MTDIKGKLRRGLPLDGLYFEADEIGLTIGVKGSRRPGVWLPWRSAVYAAVPPASRPAKIGNAQEYLDWVKAKRK